MGGGHRGWQVVAVVIAASTVGWWLGSQRNMEYPVARVVEAIDGDTIVVAFPDGHRDTIRILGVDTPETHHPRKPVQCFGPEASEYTRARLEGRRIDDELLERGYARLLVIAPNTAHARTMLSEELDAQRHHRDLWGEC